MLQTKDGILKLTPISTDDIELIRLWRNEPETIDSFFSYDLITKEKQLEWYNNISKDTTQINWVIKYMEYKPKLPVVMGGQTIGTIALQNIDLRNGKAEYVRLLIHENYRKKGFAFVAENLMLEYAFHYLNLNKIYCYTFTDNEPINKLHLKTGFKIIGVHKNHIYKKGRYSDVNIMEILKVEWQIKNGL